MSRIFRFVGLFIRTDEFLILVNSYGGERYDDSPKVLYEALLRDERFLRFHFVWAFNNPSDFNKTQCPEVWNSRTKTVKIDTLSYFVTALKSKVWITNVNIERGLHFKKKDTVYLNTWHGTGPKKSGNAYKGRKDYDFSNVDILCVDGEYQKKAMKVLFNGQEKNMLWCGRPREDELFTFEENEKKEIRRKLSIPEDKKILLYMPTWREGINHGLEWNKWEERLGKDYIVLVRAHHFSKSNIFQEHRNLFWKDVSDYQNVNELYWIADILISDYSSAIFDYGLLGRPIICFAKDHEDYMKEYGLYMNDWDKVFPNGVMQTDEQVLSFIENINYNQQSSVCKRFVDSVIHHPGDATKSCLNRLYYLIENK